MMKLNFQFLFLLATSGLAHCAIIISDVQPEHLSTIFAPDGTITLSAVVRDTQTFIRNVQIDLRANNKKMFRTQFMDQGSEPDRYEYIATDLQEDTKYCFRVKGKSKQQKWSRFSCFGIRLGTSAPTTTPTNLPTAMPSNDPTNRPTTAPTPVPTSLPTNSASPTDTPAPTPHPTAQPSPAPTYEVTPSPTATITYGLQPDCFVEDPNKFSICLDLTSASGEVEPFMYYFVDARERWENVIISNDIYYTNTDSLNKGYTATGSYPSVIDGLYIASYIKSIDGAGGILGSAGPVYYQRNDGLYRPFTGLMNFDSDDLEWMDASGLLEGVIKHEMGHVLGIGTMWNINALTNYPDGNLYLGSNVLAEWSTQGCDFVNSGAPIVEMDGGSGTAGAHFDEDCFDEELMTGYVDEGMVLSILSVGSLADMGYGVDYSEAEAFSLAGPCCSSRRNLRGDIPTTKRFSERRLSPKNKEKAVAYGKKELKRLRDNQYGLVLEKGVAVMNTIKVYMLQDGHVIDIDVSLEEEEKSV